MTPEQQRVINAAREWSVERTPTSIPEKELMVAVARLFPEDFTGKENCTCGDNAECDECPTTAEVQGYIAKLERELSSATTQ